jgi:RNA polymerase sigma-70 factor (ECF subfamily)
MDKVDLSGIPAGDMNKVMDDTELLDLLNVAVSNMPEKRKRIFELSRSKGMKNAEIAELLGVSEKTVEYHIGKALEELRKLSYIILLFF